MCKFDYSIAFDSIVLKMLEFELSSNFTPLDSLMLENAKIISERVIGLEFNILSKLASE